jgi:hypothetical protein
MKILCVFLSLAALALPAAAATNTPVTAEAVIGEVLKVIADEGWTAADVADAIKSVRGLYLRDNATKQGRTRWNGKIIKTVVDTNALTRTTTHENGRVFVDAYKLQTAVSRVAAANKRVIAATNNIPARLAAARLRRAAEINAGPTNVIVTIKAGVK